jgi:RimJ/RimL family protein N-acetyltransferase
MIRGKKVELRPISLEDFRYSYIWRNDEELAKLTAASDAAYYNNISEEKMEEIYQDIYMNFNKNEEYEFSIYTHDDIFIGKCGYRDLHLPSRRCTIGISIGDKDFRGKGYGTDALKTLIRYLFDTMNLERIQLDTWSGNEPAIRSYEKCGFVVEGRLRRYDFIDGKYYDAIIMGLLKEEFID